MLFFSHCEAWLSGMPQRTIDKSLNHLSTEMTCQAHLGNTKFTPPKCQVMSHLCEKTMFHLHQYNLSELMGYIFTLYDKILGTMFDFGEKSLPNKHYL